MFTKWKQQKYGIAKKKCWTIFGSVKELLLNGKGKAGEKNFRIKKKAWIQLISSIGRNGKQISKNTKILKWINF